MADDRSVPWRVFLAVGLGLAVIAGIYWGTSYEEGGTVLLILAMALPLWIAAYLWLGIRAARAPHPRPVEAGTAEAGAASAEVSEYLPHASAWPFAIGLGAAGVANGLVLGVWVIVPGALLMVIGIGGFVRQTRRRD
ncbi:MAG TPA: cytochrome c oxidase subunit 4 [Acidimicrobiales bacterium]|nr:cytochrome c oxidase subunit 4 [Acidimicrobiales bacterium]